MKSRGWILNALACILDSDCTNAKTVFREVSNNIFPPSTYLAPWEEVSYTSD